MTVPSGFQILYEDGPVMVVLKPGGVLTQAPPNIDSMEVRIKQFIRERDQKEGRIYLGVVHRLDRPASGVMVFGLNQRATKRLSEQFEGRTVTKKYWAIVEGEVEPEADEWIDFVRKIPGQAQSEVVPEDHPDARKAKLSYRVLYRTNGRSLLEIELFTGRTHQIRLQTSHRGYAISGDEQYGSLESFGPTFDDLRERSIGLHARSLTFRHPMTKEKVSITAPLPQIWTDAPLFDWESIELE